MNKLMGKALIIDENLTQRKTLSGYLAPFFDCQECGTKESALELLRDNLFTLIITEIRFNNVSSEDYLLRLKELQPDARILAATADPTPQTVYTAQRGQMDGLLVKPIKAKTLYDKVEMLFEQPVKTLRAESAVIRELKITLERLGAYVVVNLSGRIIGSTCSLLRNTVSGLISKGIRKIALNLESVWAIDNAGLQFIHQACHTLKTLAGEFCLFNIMKVLSSITANLKVMESVSLFLNEKEFETKAEKEDTGRMVFPQGLRQPSF